VVALDRGPLLQPPGRAGKVKQERLDFLADNPFYTKRFAYYVGQRCRAAPIKDVGARGVSLRDRAPALGTQNTRP
jgi:hypothetical protein